MSNKFYTVKITENNTGGSYTFKEAIEDEIFLGAKGVRDLERKVYSYMLEMYGIDYRKDNRFSCPCCGEAWNFEVTQNVMSVPFARIDNENF